MIKEIKTKQEFEEMLNTNGKILVDFNATWCGPCQMLKPILEEISEENNIISVDTDNLSDLAISYDVMSIPCMVLIENKEEKNRMIGFHSKEEILEFLK